MAKRYWYLLASFPYLKFGEPVDFSVEQALANMEGVVSAEDLTLAHKVAQAPLADGLTQGFSGKLAIWELFELSLRRELRLLREQRKNMHETPIAPESDRSYASLVKGAFEMKSPLEMEIALDAIRWSKLEELASGEFYTKFSLMAYLLQLKIIERHGAFLHEFGTKHFQEAYAKVHRYIEDRQKALQSGVEYE